MVENNIQQVTAYIDYFKTVHPESILTWEGGEFMTDVFIIPYPSYDKQMIRFVEEVSKSGLVIPNYLAVIEKYELLLPNGVLQHIEQADMELIKALLTYFIREEQYAEGAWAMAVKDGTFLRILSRLKELDTTS